MEKEVMLLIIFVLGMVTIGYYVSLPRLSGQIVETAFSQDLLTMGNSLDAAKSYSSSALKFSLYQACYDSLKDDLGSFEQNLADSLSRNFKSYTDEDYLFLDYYKVKFPSYQTNITNKLPGSLTVSAKGANLIFEAELSNMSIRLEKSAGLTDTVETNCWGVYQKSLDLGSRLSENIQDAVNTAISGYPEEASASYIAQEPAEQICDRILLATEGKTGIDISTGISNAVSLSPDLIITENSLEYQASASVTSMTATIVSQPKELVSNGDGTVNATCNFTYSVKAASNIKVRGTGIKHPVWNGTNLSFEQLSSNFTFQKDFMKQAPSGPSAFEISDVAFSGETSTGITITWSTSEEATAILEYGETESYGESLEIASYTKSFPAQLTGLNPSTAYHFKITATTASSETAEYTGTFTTLATA